MTGAPNIHNEGAVECRIFTNGFQRTVLSSVLLTSIHFYIVFKALLFSGTSLMAAFMFLCEQLLEEYCVWDNKIRELLEESFIYFLSCLFIYTSCTSLYLLPAVGEIVKINV
jgi:hypothetical protein